LYVRLSFGRGLSNSEIAARRLTPRNTRPFASDFDLLKRSPYTVDKGRWMALAVATSRGVASSAT
jgi:hypothetical protein